MAKLREVATEFNIKLDFSPTGNIPVQEGVYTGWVHNLIEQAVKFPIPKRAKILKMISGILTGKTWSTSIAGIPISRKARLFTKRELCELHGSLNHFATAHTSIFPKLTPLIRASASVTNYSDLIFISFKSHPWIFRTMKEIESVVKRNPWVSFDDIIRDTLQHEHYCLAFADAAGLDDFNDTFGLGGLSHSAKFAFQIPHEIYRPFLKSLPDFNPFPDHIINSEHLAQVFTVWFGFSNSLFTPGSLIELRTDNAVVCSWWNKSRCRYAAQSSMLDAAVRLARSHNCHIFMTWFPTELMADCGADDLSRKKLNYINGLVVSHINKHTFHVFTRFILPQVLFGTICLI